MIPRWISTTEMLEHLADWRAQRGILGSYALTAAVPGLLDEVHEQLAATWSCRLPPASEADRQVFTELLSELELEQRRLREILIRAFELFALAFPDESWAYRRASAALLSAGPGTRPPGDEQVVGELDQRRRRGVEDAGIRATLESTWINDTSLKELHERLVDVGLRVGPLAARLEVSDELVTEVLQEHAARDRWWLLVTSLRHLAALAGWTEPHTRAFFERLDLIPAPLKGTQPYRSVAYPSVPSLPWDPDAPEPEAPRVRRSDVELGIPVLPEFPLDG